MKRNGVLIVAILVAALIGYLLRGQTAPEPVPVPHPGEDVELTARTGPNGNCVTARVKPGSDHTFLIYRVRPYLENGKTVHNYEPGRKEVFFLKEGQEETICPASWRTTGEEAATAMAMADGGDPAARAMGDTADDASGDEDDQVNLMVFNVSKAGQCSGGECTDNFESYPLPWPPGS